MNTHFNPFPEIKTNRVVLRRLAGRDIAELHQLRSDELVNLYLNRQKPKTTDETAGFINKINESVMLNKSVYWAIGLKEDPALIGTICLWNFSADKDMADLGYELSPAYHGSGLMQEAVEAVIDYGFKMLELKIIIALTDEKNTGSTKLLKRNNFKQDLCFKYVDKQDAGGMTIYYLGKI